MKRNFSFVDLFCGAGGFSYGFKKAGFRHLLGIDIECRLKETYEWNVGKFLCKDIRKVSGEEIIREAGEKPDVIIGSPPCQGFSSSNTKAWSRRKFDRRNFLIFEFARIVNEINPEAFLMENVASLTYKPFRKFFEKFLESFSEWNVKWKVLKSCDYGVPQVRRRVFVMGFRSREPSFPSPLEKKTYPRDVLNDLVNIPKLDEMHIRYVVTAKKIPEKITYKSQAYRVKSDSFTIAVMHRSEFIHPFYDRFLTLREYARLQTFPDDFRFFGTKSFVKRFIGEAVPVNLAYVLGAHVRRILEGKA